MAAAPTPTITAYFDISGASQVFILDDPVKGVLDDATYVLAGDIATDISQYVRVSSVRRGRDRALDEITVGTANLVANNHDRIFDPSYTAGTFFGNIRPGKHVTIAAVGVTFFDGQIDDWDFDYPINTDSTAEFDVVDALAVLGSAEFDEWTTIAGQTPGARLTSILNRDEVRFPANRNIGTGTSTLQADLVTWGSNVLNYAQLVAKADLGQLFASRDGVLTFYGRNRTVTGVGCPEFRDDGTGIRFSDVQVDYGTELLFNRVSVDATGFTKQTVTDQESIDLYGVRSLSLAELPLDSALQALDLANYLLSLHKAPMSRFASITVGLQGQTEADQVAVLSLDIGSVVRVVYTPNGIGPPIDKFCMVEGISHDMAPSVHSVTLSLSNLVDGFSGQPFLLDDAEYGLLDGVGLLAF